MRPLNESDWLALWERGERRQPIDRALLLCSVVRDDIAPSELADLPLGAVNESLLLLRRDLFGETIRAHAPCPLCAERLELSLEVGELVSVRDRQLQARTWEDLGLSIRPPTCRDLAAVSSVRDAELAAAQILGRCCGISANDPRLAGNGAALETGLESVDPLSSIQIAVSCGACGRTSSILLDPGALLWEELGAAMRDLLSDVHALASTYGWTEGEILSLSRERRAAYLERAAL